MNIQRFVLPAFLAAAIHAVLLFAIPTTEVDAIIRAPEPQEIVLPPLPPVVFERAVVRPPDDTATRRVKPVQESGGPPRPEMAEQRLTVNRDFQSEMELTRRQEKGPPTQFLSPLPPGERIGDGRWTDAAPPEFFDANLLDRAPRARFQPAPDYPAELRRDGIEGEVLVEFAVDREGRVVSARAVGGDRREFAAAAVRAVLRWRFEPGRSEGRPVAFRMTVPVGFSLTRD